MIGDRVYVSWMRLGLDQHGPNAFHHTTVRSIIKRSVEVDLPDGKLSKPIASSAVHRDVGILVFRIGDYKTETSLLDPLSKSILQFFRLLLSDDLVRLHEIRTRQELVYWWSREHAAFSQVVLIGHGRRDAVLFGEDDWINPNQLRDLLEVPSVAPKTFLSLCCATGYKEFAGEFSSSTLCRSFIAPFHSVHGAVASQFCQTFFGFHLLNGETPKIAFKHAQLSIPGGSHFRLWESGKLLHGEQ